ncbi:MAG: (d)CMP kinase, partial [Planctomycetaceae bacterium]
ETVITIDGPAGSGKSSAARALAMRLGFDFLDTGAMYRCAAWSCLESDVNLVDHHRVAEASSELRIQFCEDRVFCDRIDVTTAIRTQRIADAASVVAANPRVRESMVKLQRNAARGMRIVTEGRDQGTTVFPDADCKFFLTASLQTRAERRQRQLHDQGTVLPIAEVLDMIQARDQRDVNRDVSPLRPASDAITFDTSERQLADVVDWLETTSRKTLT